MSLAERLAPHYSDFRVGDRVLLTGHSHQAWPDVARGGAMEAYELAARHIDDKWTSVSAKVAELRAQISGWVGCPPDQIALGANTHELLVRALSSLTPLREIVTTDSEFHSARRQLKRLSEEGILLTEVPAEPITTLAERLVDAITADTSAVYLSDTLFTTGLRVPHLDEVASHCHRLGAELFVDAYHTIGVAPFDLDRFCHAWVLGGGYKYLQLGEGNCFLRIPPHARELRPVVTGWFASADAISNSPKAVTYAPGGDRYAGSTYDPTAHLRAVAVGTFFQEQGLDIDTLHGNVVRQLALLVSVLESESGRSLLDPADGLNRAGFLAFTTTQPAAHVAHLRAQGIFVDHRGPWLRLGPAPYVTDAQLTKAATILGRRLRASR